MKILLMTDMEGVAGVRNSQDWCLPDSRFYDAGCRLLTHEVNAAVDGLYAGGAKYVQVADGHGAGGIDIELLDPRVEYARGWPDAWPFGLESSFTGVAWVGQHARASSELAHLAHTQSFQYIDMWVNGVAIGEFGQLALCAAEVGVPSFFGSGDQAFCQEAEALVPGIVTCPVKRGLTRGRGDTCTLDEYRCRNTAAIHIPPPRARGMIRKAAEAAAHMLKRNPPALPPLKAPFELVVILRPAKPGEPKQIARGSHATSVIELMRMPMEFHPLGEEEEREIRR